MRTTLAVLLVSVAALVSLAPATAHESHNHGTIKVHDDEVVDPAQQNNPHVSCEFWIEGFDMSDDAGWLVFESIPPTSNPPVETLNVTWSADTGDLEDGWHFLAGPFNFTAGHYRVEAFVEQGHPGNEQHFAKTKTFWVNPCEPNGEEVPCPPGLNATAMADGSIHLDWDAVENATEYRIYRAEGSDDLSSYAVVTAPTTEFHDTNTTVGVTYRYMVTAVVGGVESENCEEVEVTAIPFFGPIAGAVALVGALAGFAILRRR